MKNIITKAKEAVQTNSTKLALTAAGIASLGCIYFKGKSAGETTLYIDFEANTDENSQYMYRLRNRD